MSIEFSAKKKLKGFQMEISFNHSKGILGILGASGCGKSMTMKCIAGIIAPDEGRILVNNRVLFDSSSGINLKPQKRGVGYLFQNYALFPHMTVAENISSGLRYGEKKKRADDHVDLRELSALLQIEKLENRYPAQLSGGQQQRVALARILACRPEIILLDEPFSALDEFLREQLHLQLNELLRNWGNDVILVTHNRDEVFKLCDNLLVIDNGKVISDGTVKEVFDDPGNIKTAQLTGCKNISRARKISNYKLEALDWGIRLNTASPVPENLSAVGFRAHDFIPCLPGAANSIPLYVENISGTPFEETLILRSKGDKKLWWKRAAIDGLPLPSCLCIPAEKLLLLS